MKKAILTLFFVISSLLVFAQQWVRVNSVGYLPADKKVAVFISAVQCNENVFTVHNAVTDKVIYEGEIKKMNAARWGMECAFRLDFSLVTNEGGYYIICGKAKSPNFKIAADAYDGLADFLLTYMRQQRCGYNPYNDTLCHQHDGFIVDHPTRSGEKIDVTGGWHDATDYLQYQTTSATAAYHLMFAYFEQEDKSVFKDEYDAMGRKGANGIADILDEAKWGLEWLVKMNPSDKIMFNQIADDRDHAGFRVPQYDKVDYGWGAGEGRPVYFVTGKPQGLGKYKNRTTGVASTAGKFASTFALGAYLFKDIDPKLSTAMQIKAEQSYRFGEEQPGNTQTACLKSPYFYEEDTYTDDLELAAATIYNFTKQKDWERKADYWGELEPVSPWMELGRGRHYQFYPFINLGHYFLANGNNSAVAEKYKEYMRIGLKALKERAADDPFIYGIPFLWCSNNLVSAAITQARLYNKVTGDGTYVEMETALRDWLLGCNPWGTTMIVGYPKGADFPNYPHSSYTVKQNGVLTYGGLVDGPIYNDLFKERAGKSLTKEDCYSVFNNGVAVYHDDIGDYSSNEPTMDGTAGLTYYFATMENMGRKQRGSLETVKDAYGAIIRINPTEKNIFLVFTADSMFQGGDKILKILNKENIRGSFFLTGNCLRMPEHKELINAIIKGENYIGGHSNKHLLYALWDNRDSLIVDGEEIVKDIIDNATELEKFGVPKENSLWFLPPYEYYNEESVNLTRALGYKVVNYTPGTATPADYTTPSMGSYQSSQKLIDKLYSYENAFGLSGAVILIHPGVQDERSDKLYNRLGEIVKYLKKKGYAFKALNEI
ncbi:MAG: glycoside hydrolase family 9 protein [Bacteroidales bacterium]